MSTFVCQSGRVGHYETDQPGSEHVADGARALMPKFLGGKNAEMEKRVYCRRTDQRNHDFGNPTCKRRSLRMHLSLWCLEMLSFSDVVQ